jgi:uncharacterized protein YcbK (DUF882 family)
MAQGVRAAAGRGASIAAGSVFLWLSLLAASAGLAAGSGETPAVAVPEAKPEIRRLRMRHHWIPENLDVVYKVGDAYQPEAMAEINHFMRDWHCDKTVEMDPKLIDRIYELQQAVGPRRTIRLISGYRSEGYNASLLAAGHVVDPNSEHMSGKAADIFVPGFSPDRLRQAAEEQGHGGVGYYPFSGPRFVHVDTGPNRHWTETDPGVKRRLGLVSRPRKPLKLNCSLTMAEVLNEVSPDKAFAALPQGAAVAPLAAKGTAGPGAADAPAPQTAALSAPAPNADRERFCQTSEQPPLDALHMLTPPAEPQPKADAR